ncbi:MAG: HEAT repeat protein [Bacteriovoracaceae bacterium]|jgi:HEAT repeat protein
MDNKPTLNVWKGKAMAEANPKKLLENKFLGGLVVPIAIVLVGALIIVGVTKMLSTERSYKDLVREIQSKTFGNRWVAAYELSKVISSSQVPAEEVPWLVENLTGVYDDAKDPRTRDFIVVAVGALKSEAGLDLLGRSLDDLDKNVKFHGLVALGNYPLGTKINNEKILSFLESEDFALQQAAILVAGTHKMNAAVPRLVGLLTSDNTGIRYAAASALIPFKNQAALPTLKEILLAAGAKNISGISLPEMTGLKLSLINALQKNNWSDLNETLIAVVNNEQNAKVISEARSALNQLKK